MDEHSNPGLHDNHSLAAGRRFLRIFAWCVSVTAVIVASVNLVAYNYMLRDNNQAIVQLVAGWGRMYKPILYDEAKPNVAVYGASWARDAFDPDTTGRIIGLKVFNHAVSGGTAYETRRFADSSLDNPNLQAAIVNLNNFYRSEIVARVRYGFDESILDVDPEHKPNHWVALKRTYSLALTGWAAGANLKLFSTLRARDSGAAPSEYLKAYQRADHTRRSGSMETARQRIFPEPGRASEPSQPDPPPQFVSAELEELEVMIDGFCEHGIDVYAYFTPAHVRSQDCNLQATKKLAALEFLRRKQTMCKARISYFDFAYPNAVTLEGVLTPVTSSKYYRPDGHPRPTMGELMAASMFDREFPPDTPAVLEEDFGVDLLTQRDAEGWLLERAARCEGDWGENGYTDFKDALLAQ
jgi:hypothetical protein